MAAVAGIADPTTLRAQMAAKSGWNFKTIALSTAAFAATFLGGLGLGASLLIDRHKNHEVAKDQKKILAKHYREQIATQLGVDPQSVNVADLEMAARVNPQFAQLVRKVEEEQSKSDAASVAGTAGGFALGGMLPGWSAAADLMGKGIAKTVGHVGGAIGGSMASGLLNKDTLLTQDIVEHINEKVTQGQPIVGQDIMLLRISQDEKIQDAIHKQGGKAFHKMNEAEQRAVAAAMPELFEAAEMDAVAFNSGRLTEQDLLVTSPGMNQIAAPKSQPAWTQRVGGKRAPQGSFVQAYQAETAGTTRNR